MLPWLPENVSTYGPQIDSLFYLIFYITDDHLRPGRGRCWSSSWSSTGTGRAAARPTRTATPRSRSSGRSPRRSSWSCSRLLSRGHVGRDQGDHCRRATYQVQVTAKQFNWEIAYPGPDGKFGTADDVTLDNDLPRPGEQGHPGAAASRATSSTASSCPVLRLKQDALPGREILAVVRGDQAGRYEIPCAELCGFGHSGMKGMLTVHSQPRTTTRWVQGRSGRRSTAAAACRTPTQATREG